MNVKSPAALVCLVLAVAFPCWAGSTHTVHVGPPSGGDDTATLQAALDECVALGPGCTVQLAAGTYLTRQLFTKDFHGTFTGKGMDVTIIQALPNLPVSQDNPVWMNPPTADNKYPMLVLFFGGDITVSDMTIRALEGHQLQAWFIHEDFATTYMWAVLEFMGQSEAMNVVVNRVALQGTYAESGPEYSGGYNASGLSIDPYPTVYHPPPGRLSGTFRISASRFDTFVEAMGAAALSESRLAIGGSPSEANVFQNSACAAILLDLNSSTVDFSYNDVTVSTLAFAGIVAWQAVLGPVAAPSSFLVQRNRIKATGSYQDGIWLVDYGTVFGEGKTGDFAISNNEITIEPSQGIPAYAGIETDFTEGTIISNNRIVGGGLFGMALEGDTQAMVKANNVQEVTAEYAPIGLMTNLWFAPDIVVPTTDSTVVGFGQRTNAYDEGIDNTLVGVNNMQGHPPGPAIRDAMKRRMEMVKSVRKP